LNVVTDSDKNKDLIRQWIAFGNAGFAGGFEPFISDDYIGHLDATAMDRNELERLERQFCVAFPDAQHSIDDLIAEAIVWFFERQRGYAPWHIRGHCSNRSTSGVHWPGRIPDPERQNRRVMGRNRLPPHDS
jgi:hypothetical protein